MNEVLTIFTEEYKKLSDKEQETFAYLTNKMINVNYLTASKEEDKKDYYFIVTHFEVFKNYFLLSARELTHYSLQKTLVLTSEYTKKLSLNKNNSLLLLILRLLYHQKLHDISLENKVITSIGELQSKCEQFNFDNLQRFKTIDLTTGLTLFKKYNIINFKGNNFQKDDTLIEIYPTIQYIVEVNNIKQLNDKINSYQEKGDSYEKNNEDKID